uniref:reprolysin-like metallopeptidase n=10 Tax=Acinetobacter TaxID=469 RepID=UPI003221F907
SKFYKKYQDKNLAIKNYVFVTNVSKKEGVGSGGESVVLLKCPQNIFNQVVVHELGHRFGLDHIFEAQKLTAKGSSFQFLRGTTANFLDYDHRKSDDNEKNNNKSKAIANPNLSLKYFFKYQWDLLRNRVK